MAAEVENKVNDKYKGIKPEIASELRVYENQYFREDKPIPFCGLLIYPALVHDYEAFSNCTSCLTLNKNETVDGLRMTHLEFLISQTQIPGEEGMSWSYKIQKLCEIVFHLSNGIRCTNSECHELITYDSEAFQMYIQEIQELQQSGQKDLPMLKCPKCGGSEFREMIKIIQDKTTKKFSLLIDGHQITSKDFDRFRQIVLFQNFPDYRDDSWVDPALKADYQARLELEQKKNDVQASVEKRVVSLSIATNYKFDEIFDMSIRKFTMALSTVDDLINYKIMRTAIMSGFASLPQGKTIEHWIYKSEKDMYGDAYKDVDAIKHEAGNL